MNSTYIIFKFLHVWGMFALVTLVFSLFLCITSFNIYKNNGKKIITSFIPIYNLLILLDIVKLNRYYFVMLVLPVTNVLIILYILYRISIIYNLKTINSLALIIIPIIYIPLLNFKISNKKINVKKNTTNDINLMSDEEINSIEEDDSKVDNVFKIENKEKEEVPIFKATNYKYRQMMLEDEDLDYVKRIEPKQLENLKQIHEENNDENDKVEIIEL